MFSSGHTSVVQRAMRAVRRVDFLPPEQRPHAGEDVALPIACHQTISQPSLVAYMTEELRLTASSRVLEIGTGSGFQTAILAEIAGEVFTMERIAELAHAAEERLARLGYRNIRYRIGDGALGWPEAAPFDGIIVTAAAPQLPPALVAQLTPRGRLVVPVGSVAEDNQSLELIVKGEQGEMKQSTLCAVRFVPLVSGTQSS